MNQQFEYYTEQVRSTLDALPIDERNKEITELRQHLEALMEANRELGDTEEVAAENALRQIGEAKRLSQSLVNAWRRGNRPFFGTFLASLFTAILSAFLLAGLMWFVGMAINYAYLPFNGQAWVTLGIMTLLASSLSGWLTGIVTPKRAVVGTASGLIVLNSAITLREIAAFMANNTGVFVSPSFWPSGITLVGHPLNHAATNYAMIYTIHWYLILSVLLGAVFARLGRAKMVGRLRIAVGR